MHKLHRSIGLALLVPWGALLLAGGGRAAEPFPIQFDDVTDAVGLRKPLAGIMGHGGAWGDVDGDGRPDLFVGGFCDRAADQYAPASSQVPTRLFRNTPEGFVPWQEETTRFYSRTSGALFVDLDNNGTLELYSANNARPQSKLDDDVRRAAQVRLSNLFCNQSGTLEDISAASGACPPQMRSARNIGALDYNGDGLLDLLVVEDRFVSNPSTLLFKNLGDLKFQIVNDEVGLPRDAFGLGLAVADMNLDGKPDFFLPHSNRFFLSTGDGRYREDEKLNATLSWEPLNREDWPCGAVFADLNRDGRLDLVLSIHHEVARNKVYLNEGLIDGVPQFKDVTEAAGLAEIPQKCPHVEVQDFDNDGWPDIYLSAAWLDEQGNVTPLIYRNQGTRNGIPRFAPSRPIQGPMVYYPAGPSADYDGDGRVDLFLINWFQGNHCRLLRNTSEGGHWLKVSVRGTKMNRMGLGAKVSVYAAGKLGKSDALVGHQELSIGYGYASGQEAVCHFGLGRLDRVDVEVVLPDGTRLSQRGVAADQHLTVTQPQ